VAGKSNPSGNGEVRSPEIPVSRCFWLGIRKVCSYRLEHSIEELNLADPVTPHAKKMSKQFKDSVVLMQNSAGVSEN
jgi:hypothetical protein